MVSPIAHAHAVGREAAQAIGGRSRRPARRGVRRRRRYTLALPDEHGTEISLPALPRLRIGPRTFTALLLGVWLITARRAWADAQFKVTEVTVEGAALMSDAQVESIARLQGSHVFALDPAAVEERLTSYSEIDAADVRLLWPGNKVTIEVEERRPIVEWSDGGKTWWLSASGVAFIQREPYKAMVRVTSEELVLQISQEALEPAIEPKVLWSAVKLSEQLPFAADLSYSASYGFGFEDPRGWSARFGFGGDMDTKLDVYNALTLSLLEQGLDAEVVSVQDPYAPYYRLAR